METFYYSIEYQQANPEEQYVIHPLKEQDSEETETEEIDSTSTTIQLDETNLSYHGAFEPISDPIEIDSKMGLLTTSSPKKRLFKSLVKLDTSEGGRPKKGRKQKIPGQSREDRKLKANTNKAYVNAKGIEVQPKKFDENFDCGCPKKCCEKLDVKVRRAIFNMFWCMGTYEGRCCFINGNVNEIPKKRTYIKTPEKESRRKFTRKYYLKGIEVCKVAFCRTLHISSSRIDISLSKLESDSIGDQRGRGKKVNALSDERLEEILNHIASFPTSDGRHLSSELTLRKMYHLYREQSDNPVSESSYKKQFYQNFNLKFKRIKREQIVKVEKIEMPAIQF